MGSTLQKQISLVFSVLFSCFLTYLIILSLSELRTTVTPELYLIRTALALFGFFFPILGGWFSLQVAGGAIFALFAAVMVFFVSGVTASSVFLWFLMEYAALYYLLFRTDQNFENQLAGIAVDREKYQNEKNDLEVAHKAKGEGISILFEKYSTYYNLRKLAEELATSLSVAQLSQMIVQHTADLIAQGDLAVLSLTDAEGLHLSVLASRPVGKGGASRSSLKPPGDLLDSWVIKNQRRLIVTHAHQDFRFDVKEAARQEDLKSVIIAPLLHERKIMGILRLQSAQPEAFSNDDLRLLDTIAVLASSALSNAMLFEQTEELAIKDSMTGLYIRRYFYERLKEEHRRALLTHRPLSLLMCDLDFFKACNDKYGHGVGDLMLIHFAQILKNLAGEGIITARYGGEEFALLMPEVSRKDALVFAEKIRKTVEETKFEVRRERLAMTVSIGVASLPEDTLDMENLIQKADDALYTAKREGRNRVC